MDPVFRHNRQEVLQASNIDGMLDKAFPRLLELLESRHREALDGLLTTWRHFGLTLPGISH